MGRDAPDTAMPAPGGTMARPLLWSTAAHLLALSACLVLAAGRGPDLRTLPVVEVLLVGAEPGRAGPARFPAASTRRPGRVTRPPHAGSPEPAATRAEQAPAAPAVPAPDEPSGAVLEPEGPGAVRRAAEEAAAVAAVGTADRPGGADAASESGAAFVSPPARGAESGPAVVPPGGGAEGAAIASPGAGAAPGAAVGGAGGEGGRRGDPGLLRDRIQSRIVYPEEAVRRGLEGEVVLRIRIGTGGVPSEIRVARSSGARLLDDAARRGVARAAPLPSSPGWVEVPVRFRLR